MISKIDTVAPSVLELCSSAMSLSSSSYLLVLDCRHNAFVHCVKIILVLFRC